MHEHADPELLKKLNRAMLKLPRSTREIFLAHRLDDLSYQEIADRSGLTVRQVERHMSKAIYRMCKELDDEPHWWERFAIVLRQCVGWLWRTENNRGR